MKSRAKALQVARDLAYIRVEIKVQKVIMRTE
jgi:hypothetical protein